MATHTQRQLHHRSINHQDRPEAAASPRRALELPTRIAYSEYPRQDWAACLLVSPRRAPPWIEKKPPLGCALRWKKNPWVFWQDKKRLGRRSCRRSADLHSSSSQSAHHWHSASGVLPPSPSSFPPPGHHGHNSTWRRNCAGTAAPVQNPVCRRCSGVVGSHLHLWGPVLMCTWPSPYWNPAHNMTISLREPGHSTHSHLHNGTRLYLFMLCARFQ